MSTASHRPIRSFVRRQGRITIAQRQALEALLPNYRFTKEHATKLLAADKQLILEVGFGNGETLLAMARERPEYFFIGAEVYRPGLGRCLLRTQQEQLDNIAVFDRDVNQLLTDVLPAHSLDQTCIFFPDPWPKKRHHKRRLVSRAFVQQLATRTRVGGLLFMATDWRDYATAILEVMAEQRCWQNLSKTGNFVSRAIFRPLTRFERRGTQLGHQVFDFRFQYQPTLNNPE
ncbi:MAG TPA: tRNA (guanosine(46)-N7)-methyltransferase TrmB [Gammaproteobacteria bacterium]|nr:tRNA (guanosine(46)-N7)-methyltransferase TrmB [Gammaproteobacteria bacterium]